MTEPTPLERLRDAIELVRQAGPFLTRVELTQTARDALRTAVEDRDTRTLPSTLVSAWGVPLQVAEDLPAGAVRLHYSDGRVVTRWAVRMHPKALQVSLQVTRHGKSHGLRLMLNRHGFGWTPAWRDDAGRAVEHVWNGERVSAYLPGLAVLASALTRNTPPKG